MGADPSPKLHNLPRRDLMRLAGIYLGEVLLHYGLWFSQAGAEHGTTAGVEMEQEVSEKYFPGILRRLGPHLGIPMTDGIPDVISQKTVEELLEFIEDIGKTWLAGDGIWFQELEGRFGLDEAKQINDACWSHFAHLEASKIKDLLGIGPECGLRGLEKGLGLRIYAAFNANESEWDDHGGLLFRMTECRVQSTRRRKGLPDYPCKSAGMAEFSAFSAGMDPRVTLECVSCPPDPVDEDAYCKWRFSLK